MKFKKKIMSTCTGVGFLLASCFVQAEDNNAFATEKVFKGEAVPTITSIIKYGFNDSHRGILDYAARPGSFFKAAEYDAKGNVIKSGDILLHMNPTFRESTYQKASAELEASIANCENAEQIYKRNENLIKSHSVSEVIYQTTKMEYIKAKAQVEASKCNLALAKQMVDICTFRAPFEGVVDQVFICAGLMAGEQPAIQISQLVPMGIKVKMDREIASQININTPIKVFPLNSNTPINAFPRGYYYPVENGVYEKDEIMFTVDNYQIPPPVSLDENGKQIPVITKYWFVLDYKNRANADSNIAIMESCIYKDLQGDYVWKLKSNKYLQPEKGNEFISPVQKVYVKTGNYSQYEASYIKTITVVPSSELKPGDILLTGILPEELKEGDKVCLYDGNYLFMPGDPVKVVIGPNKSK